MVIIIHVWHFAASAEVNALVDSDKIGSLILAASCYFIGSLIVVRPALLEPSDGPQIPSYRTSRLTPNELSSLADQLESFVRQNEAFRNPALSLEDLAEGVGTTAHTLSQVLSQAFDINFYGYINAKRVEAVIETFAEERHRDVPLMHIATDCGFNSKSSFYRAFKAHTGTTPSAFRESSQIARKAGPN